MHRGLADSLATNRLHRRMSIYGWDGDIGMDTNINGAANGTATPGGRLLSHGVTVESS